jgi:hypothetical protein
MNSRWYAGLFIASTLIILGIAWLETSPGYMDADYYYASGLRIATDNTWDEPFLWNYLSDPVGLPQPAFTYWMPLAGILSALGITLTGRVDFWSARMFFILLGGSISPLAAYMAATFSPKRWAALLAGALGIFSGFYLVYLPTTETFGIYMVLGAMMFLLIRRMQQDSIKVRGGEGKSDPDEATARRTISPIWIYLAGGGVAGFMYMTRADGLIWLVMILGAIIMQVSNYYSKTMQEAKSKSTGFIWIAFIMCMGAFLVVASPWVIRNWQIYGTIFAPGSGRALWLNRYDELFIYPADRLTFSRWIGGGLVPILQARAWAFGLNAVSTLAVQGGIFLLPLILVGLWIKRKDWRVVIGGLGWLATFLAMTIIFPFQGARGGYFHAGAGFQILFWALVPVGLERFIEWGRQKRDWSPDLAQVKFGIGIIGLTILVTGFVSWQRLIGDSGAESAWGAKSHTYEQVETYLKDYHAASEDIVMVNNPPGYFAVTGRQAIVIPDGDLDTALRAAEKYDARLLILDQNYPQGLEEIYQEPGDYPGLRYLETIADMHIYLMEP